MEQRQFLILHRNEWERLKRQCYNPEPPAQQNEYIKRLAEISQKWIRSWPDTVEGYIKQVEKDKEAQHARDISVIKKFTSRCKKDTEAIKNAKQQIFDASCYGNRLISALIESKTLEERDAQIKFKKELKQKEVDMEQEYLMKNNQYNSALEKDEREIYRKKLKEIETAKINKTTFEMQQTQRAKDKERKKKQEIQDLRIIQEILNKETELEEKNKISPNQHDEHCEIVRKMKENRAKNEEIDDKLRHIWQKYQDRVRCKEKLMYHQIHAIPNSLHHQNNYLSLEKIQSDEIKKYNNFIEKGIIRVETRMMEKDNKKRVQEKQTRRAIATQNKGKGITSPDIYCCERQTLLMKSNKTHLKEELIKEKELKSLAFLAPDKTLLKELRRREKEPNLWNNVKSAHEQFAHRAQDTLRQCQYKNTMRKVIQDYRNLNCLSNLPIPN